MKYLLLGLGGAAGTISRYLIQTTVFAATGGTFPLGTLIVNLTGSFIIGLLWGMQGLEGASSDLKLFLFVGLLGGFTTFSSFSLESLNLLRMGEAKYFMLNVLASNVLGIALAFAGFLLSKNVFRI